MCRQPDCLCRKSDGIYKKLLEPLSPFSLVARYEINIQLYFYILAINRTLKFKNDILFITKNRKYLSETKYVKNPYVENYKTLLRKIKEDLTREIHRAHWVRIFNIVKMTFLPKLI